MEKKPNPASCSRDRKAIERNRRNQMKELYSNLSSLVPPQISKEPVSLPDQLDHAAKYIKKLQTNLEKLRLKKERLSATAGNSGDETAPAIRAGTCRPPKIEIREMGSALEVVLITGSDSKFVFNDTIRVIQEEGGEIVNASFSVSKDLVFHTIHSKIGGGGGAARISERLKKIVGEYGG